MIISSDTPTGNLWGNMGTVSFESDISPGGIPFTSQPSLGINTSNPQAIPQEGPTSITWDGIPLSFIYNLANGGDVYYDPGTTSMVIISPGNSVTAIQPYQTLSGSYDSNTKAFSNLPGIAAVSPDGMSMLGLPPGITVLDYPNGVGDPGDLTLGDEEGVYNSGTGADYIMYRPNGTVLYKYTSEVSPSMFYSFPNVQSSQPPYWYPGGELLLDARAGFPSSAWPAGIARFSFDSLRVWDGVAS